MEHLSDLPQQADPSEDYSDIYSTLKLVRVKICIF